MTHDSAAHIQAVALRRRTAERHREALENLRRLEIQLQTASALERRADRSVNAAFAAVLRERAQERRRIAEVVRAHLVEADTAAVAVERTPSALGPDRVVS